MTPGRRKGSGRSVPEMEYLVVRDELSIDMSVPFSETDGVRMHAAPTRP
jgi:hypothetical protein